MSEAVLELESVSVPSAGERGSPTAARRRVLFVSYHFPPVGGAGVQRPVKFVKYLREFGWEPTVLRASNPSVPVFDESLCRDLPEGLRQIAARTLEPAYDKKQALAKAGGGSTSASWKRRLTAPLRAMVTAPLRLAARAAIQPDPQILWWPAAWRAARKVLREEPHDAVFATAPPYSNLLLGGLLAREFNLPLVLDYRDEWDLSGEYLENSRKDPWTRFVQERMQRWILRRADAIVATTRASTARVLARARSAGGRCEAACIYNGYDEADFPAESAGRPDIANASTVPPPAPGTLRLVYTGTLWNLTSIDPVVRGLERLMQIRPDASRRIELVCVGRKTPEQQAHLDRLNGGPVALVVRDYCPHAEAVEWMRSADALLLLLTDGPGADRVAPAKLFEYLAVGKPILSVLPDGETASLVSEFWPEGWFVPSRVDAIADWLARAVDARTVGRETPGSGMLAPLGPVERVGAERFSRRGLAGQLGTLLDELVDRRESVREGRPC
jgi:glycosyltransferase involved in cell wall biosynthesis